jgi:LPXTG-motif cell wall-anchored protein
LALNLTPRRRFGVALGVAVATVSTGLIGFAGTAGAHTNRSAAECVDDTTTLTVDLTAYNKKKDNSVKITDNGSVVHEGTFKENYREKFEVPGDVEHTFTIEVKAWDDPKAEKGWSFTDEHKVEACVEVTTPPSTTTETTPPSETTTTTTEVPPTSTSSEAPPVPTTPPTTTTTTPEVQEEALAETGASIALPLGIAGVLIVGGAGALFVVRRRSKA